MNLYPICMQKDATAPHMCIDRKSTRLNSSHANNSYAVFCLKKKKAGEGSEASEAGNGDARRRHETESAAENGGGGAKTATALLTRAGSHTPDIRTRAQGVAH